MAEWPNAASCNLTQSWVQIPPFAPTLGSQPPASSTHKYWMKKKCGTCKREKNTSDFRKDRTQPDELQYQCKVCARLKDRSNYTEKYYTKYRPIQNARITENIKGINLYKSSGCIVCKETELSCLDLHHTDPEQKDFTISDARTLSWKRIESELQKCAVLCRNCHAKFHAGVITLPR